ncbi:GNAT family N-acetyltransferase [Sinorhizobium medicae]|uniref:GNAT family N-acetyltransferase n=1 Tax=Sinorhizobium medicae TaxID=110321 RepID=UPI000FDB2274|nr:GNAT family N-acetyltransferase [Sinorhizobium medicae]RVP47817.1 GNAT family N-acetyltransferase [Sinorhizobium medicae]RVP74595.1 GNAT family N-acetyltransferase [Sinorhizobium medicae]UWU12554.1 GNAT family N-acetyltransferase [Sinorhizobium medicae]
MNLHPSLTWLTDDAPPAMRTEARAFCLGIIRDFYKIDYTPAWHSDLDSLLDASPTGWFSAERRGAFLVVVDEHARVVAAGGLYDLQNKPAMAVRLQDRHGDIANICHIVRVYLEPDRRRKGLGGAIVAALERKACDLGYRTSYLHADAETPGTLRFWRRQGYSEFGRFSYPSAKGMDTSVHFDKSLLTE